MRRTLSLLVGLLLMCHVNSLLWGLGSDHGKGPVRKHEHWPEGLQELANKKERVHGYFVNAEDVFFYAGDTKAFNDFLAQYARLKDTSLELVLHVGKKKARSPWDKEDRDIHVDWTLYASPGIGERGEEAPLFVTRIDLWLSGSVRLDLLEVPANVVVKSGGEIERFISEHQKKAKAANATSRPTIAIYTEDRGLRTSTKIGPHVIVAAWADGRIVWSKNGVKGGPPYLEGQFDPECLNKLLNDLEGRGVFKDKSLTRAHFGPDSSFTVIRIEAGKRRLTMQSWHELYEQNPNVVATEHGLGLLKDRSRDEVLKEQPESYRKYRKVWSEIRTSVASWIPAEGKPYKGDVAEELQ